MSTISAIATANGIGSIAIVRVSGDMALDIALKLTKLSLLKPRCATLCDVYDKDSNLLDEAIVIYFKAPYSFTGEDIVEFQCHGGFVVANSILKATLDAGSRIANAGEFSKRAFLNGKIDLSKAEAIAALIESKSQDAQRVLLSQLKGELSRFVDSLRDEIITILAYSEVSIDYADEDLPLNIVEDIIDKLNSLYEALKKTLKASKSRDVLINGFKIAIIGKPNVGKSSLLNAMLNYQRAIVSDVAGTTRDTIEEHLKIGTHLVKIIDTAGIRLSSDTIEQLGIDKSKEALMECDIAIVLFDASREIDDEDSEILSLIDEYKDQKKIFYIKNKIDLEQKFQHTSLVFDLSVSSKESVSALMELLEKYMNNTSNQDELMLISQRQISSVSKTLDAIASSYEPLKNGELEIFSFYLLEAIKELSSITKGYDNDEVLDKMFSNFCLGK